MDDTATFKQPREGRIIGGVIALVLGGGVTFFALLIALESFGRHPLSISVFFLLGFAVAAAGLFFALCVPVLEIDCSTQRLRSGLSILFTGKFDEIPFSRISEVGLKEAYHAGDRTEESGTFYSVELRGAQTITVPGSETTKPAAATACAERIAGMLQVRFNAEPQKVFTGGFKLR